MSGCFSREGETQRSLCAGAVNGLRAKRVIRGLKGFRVYRRKGLIGVMPVALLTLHLFNPLTIPSVFGQANFYQGKTVKIIIGSTT